MFSLNSIDTPSQTEFNSNPEPLQELFFFEESKDTEVLHPDRDSCSGTAHLDETQLLLQQATAERDSYWRSRVKEATESQVTLASVQVRQAVTNKFSVLLKKQTEITDKIREERDALAAKTASQETQIQALTKQVSALETEVKAGQTIIHQFSQLMRDKASSICQYCRRSGTLPPIPTR